MAKRSRKGDKRRSKSKPMMASPAVICCRDTSASTLLLGMFLGWQLKRFVTWLNKPYESVLTRDGKGD